MGYRTVAKWEIDIGEMQETQGLARMFGSLYRQEFGINFEIRKRVLPSKRRIS
ncbi:MAG: hypothetical protein ACOY3M_04595 [Patescibacteria group bacterium]